MRKPVYPGKLISILIFLALVMAIATVSSTITMSETLPGGWHDQLVKPAWNPPNWVFGPVWTVLYILIAFSGWVAWKKQPARKFTNKLLSTPMFFYWVQLLLNFLWTILFFGHHALWLSVVDIVLLLGAIAMTMKYFYPIQRWAAFVLIPYFLWVLYASTLNIAIAVLN